MNSKTRPAKFTRSYRTEEADYDHQRMGWKTTLASVDPPDSMHPIEKRRIYDTTQPGRGNRGHTFGDKLSDDERTALIEYLKML